MQDQGHVCQSVQDCVEKLEQSGFRSTPVGYHESCPRTGLAVSNESVNDKVDPFFVFIYLFIAH